MAPPGMGGEAGEWRALAADRAASSEMANAYVASVLARTSHTFARVRDDTRAGT